MKNAFFSDSTTAVANATSQSNDGALYVAVAPASPGDYGRAISIARTLHRSDIPASLEERATGPVALLVRGEAVELWADGIQEKAGPLEEVVPLLLRYK